MSQSTKDITTLTDQDNKLVQLALDALKNAYTPYSNFFVGCALVTEKGNIYVGCNVENASYGATICAERTAIVSAVAQEGPSMRIKTIAALCQNREGKIVDGCSCGVCRQVITEFSTSETRVIYQFVGKLTIRSISELLPDSFNRSNLVID